MKIDEYSIEKERLVEILLLIKNFIFLQYIDYDYTGICKIVTTFNDSDILSYSEYAFVKKFLAKNRPTKDNKFSEFTKNKYWIDVQNGYWWSKMYDEAETIQIRLNYLDKLIENLK